MDKKYAKRIFALRTVAALAAICVFMAGCMTYYAAKTRAYGTEKGWPGFCATDCSLQSVVQDNKWFYFLIMLSCFLVGMILIGSYFRILDRQYEMEQRRRRMSDAVAHEMKTPLGIIKNYSEALSEEKDEEKRKLYLDTIVEETDGMNDMIVNMLDLSRMEAGTYPLELSVLSVDEVLQGVLKRTKILMQPENLQVETEFSGKLQLLADEKLLTESLSNLILNAITHSDPDSVIRITLKNENNGVRAAVYNQGKPISEKDMERVWECFYRGDAARNRKQGGNGLGLSIVSNACLLHGGAYGCENKEKGVEFWFWIPSQEDGAGEKTSAKGSALYLKKRDDELQALKWSLTGSFVWFLAISYVTFGLRDHSAYDPSKLIVPWAASIPGWLLSWIGARYMNSFNKRLNPAFLLTTILLAAGLVLFITSGTHLDSISTAAFLSLSIVAACLYLAGMTAACRKIVNLRENHKLGKRLWYAAAAGIFFGILLIGAWGYGSFYCKSTLTNLASALYFIAMSVNLHLWYDVYKRFR